MFNVSYHNHQFIYIMYIIAVTIQGKYNVLMTIMCGLITKVLFCFFPNLRVSFFVLHTLLMKCTHTYIMFIIVHKTLFSLLHSYTDVRRSQSAWKYWSNKYLCEPLTCRPSIAYCTQQSNTSFITIAIRKQNISKCFNHIDNVNSVEYSGNCLGLTRQ